SMHEAALDSHLAPCKIRMQQVRNTTRGGRCPIYGEYCSQSYSCPPSPSHRRNTTTPHPRNSEPSPSPSPANHPFRTSSTAASLSFTHSPTLTLKPHFRT